jgi:hypothetical protein
VQYDVWRDDFFVFFCTIDEAFRVLAMLVAVVTPDVLLNIVTFRGRTNSVTGAS